MIQRGIILPGAFELGLMWAVYHDMEKIFLNFLEYVPLASDHSKVYSYKLLHLMLQIGGYIDTSFKEMATHSSFDGNEKCKAIRGKAVKRETVGIDLAREAFEPIYHLSSRLVLVKSPAYLARVIIERWSPFVEFKEGKSPKWWKAYNEVKHDWLANLEQANVRNTLYALASAFLLNVVHEPSILALTQWGHVKTLGTAEQQAVSPEIVHKILNGKRPLKDTPVAVETPLFIWVVSSKH